MKYKLVVYVPTVNARAVRDAMGEAGAGRIGNYTFCSFSTRGTGRFRPEAGANPHIGTVGQLETVEEERIEVAVDGTIASSVIAAMKRAHPYEEVVYDVYALEPL